MTEGSDREEIKRMMEFFLGPGPARILWERYDDEMKDDEEFTERVKALITSVVGTATIKKDTARFLPTSEDGD